MAAAMLDHHAGGYTFGRQGARRPTRSTPAVVAAMDENGLDLRKQFPKPPTTEIVEAANAVVTMGCGDLCPVFPGKRYLDGKLTDPRGKPVDDVRPIRDEIDGRFRQLLSELVHT